MNQQPRMPTSPCIAFGFLAGTLLALLVGCDPPTSSRANQPVTKESPPPARRSVRDENWMNAYHNLKSATFEEQASLLKADLRELGVSDEDTTLAVELVRSDRLLFMGAALVVRRIRDGGKDEEIAFLRGMADGPESVQDGGNIPDSRSSFQSVLHPDDDIINVRKLEAEGGDPRASWTVFADGDVNKFMRWKMIVANFTYAGLATDDAEFLFEAHKRGELSYLECFDIVMQGPTQGAKIAKSLAQKDASSEIPEKTADRSPREPTSDTETTAVRTWTDQNGTFSVKATFVRRIGDKVVLQRADGLKIQVPFATLSVNDVNFINDYLQRSGQISASLIRDFAELRRATNSAPSAESAFQLYQLFSSDNSISPKELRLARQEATAWEDRAEHAMVRAGKTWLTLAKLRKAELQEKTDVARAEAQLAVDDREGYVKSLTRASKANPASIDADFELGLVYALLGRNAEGAKTRFRECTNRLVPPVTLADRANLMSAYNNLAIAEVRTGTIGRAVLYWRSALELGKPSPEIVQNISRCAYLAASLQDKDRQVQHVQELHHKVSQHDTGQEFDKTVGWLYMRQVRGGSGANQVSRPRDASRKIGRSSGFVVHPGFVLTSRSATQDANGFVVVASGGRAIRLDAHLIAEHPSLDVALLKCPELTVKPLPISSSPLKLGTNIGVLGYAMVAAEEFAPPDLSRGNIARLPNEGSASMLYSFSSQGDWRGSPVLDGEGHVIAAHGFGLGRYAGGVPISNCIPFLKEHIVGFDVPDDALVLDGWEDIASKRSDSIVQIEVLADLGNDGLGTMIAKTFGKSSTSWEDPWCLACNGYEVLPCPAKGCNNGGRAKKSFQSAAYGTSVVKFSKVKCTTCGGDGFVDCKRCYSGRDPLVR